MTCTGLAGAKPGDDVPPGDYRVARHDLSWVGRLDELGIEHGGIVDAPYGSGLSFRYPDGIALEFFALPG